MATHWPYVQRVGTKWRGYYRGGDGRKRFLRLRATAQEASEEAIAMRKLVRDGGAAGMTIGDLSQRFLEDVRRTRTVGTWDFYAQQLRGVFAVLPKETLLLGIGPAEMRTLIDAHREGRFSHQTIQHRRAVLRRMFRWARKAKLHDADPTESVEWPKVTANAFDVIPGEQLAAILDQLRAVPADFDLVVVAVYTGLRRAELARLRIDEIDLDSGILWVTGKRRREPVVLTPDVVPCLRAMIDRTGGPWLIPESQAYRGPKAAKLDLTPAEIAERQRAATVANVFRRWAKKLGDRRFHPHTLRHSLATELARQGHGIETVGRLLRHREAQTTRRYLHLADPDLRRALSGLRLLQDETKQQDHG